MMNFGVVADDEYDSYMPEDATVRLLRQDTIVGQFHL